MKEITLYVPDEKVEFVKELANQLGIDAFDAEECTSPKNTKPLCWNVFALQNPKI